MFDFEVQNIMLEIEFGYYLPSFCSYHKLSDCWNVLKYFTGIKNVFSSFLPDGLLFILFGYEDKYKQYVILCRTSN